MWSLGVFFSRAKAPTTELMAFPLKKDYQWRLGGDWGDVSITSFPVFISFAVASILN